MLVVIMMMALAPGGAGQRCQTLVGGYLNPDGTSYHGPTVRMGVGDVPSGPRNRRRSSGPAMTVPSSNQRRGPNAPSTSGVEARPSEQNVEETVPRSRDLVVVSSPLSVGGVEVELLSRSVVTKPPSGYRQGPMPLKRSGGRNVFMVKRWSPIRGRCDGT